MLKDCKLSVHTAQNKDCKYSDNFFRILTDDYPEKNYAPRQKNENRTAVHFGQRKLFLSEVEFLTKVCTTLNANVFKKIVLIYAGAAPGNHIDMLSNMFPFVKFVLVDPAKFAIQPTEKIVIRQEFFTDEMALDLRQEYDDYIRLFVSDIRRAGPGMNLKDDIIEEEVLEDMRSQETWYFQLEPYKSLLKFRPPYIKNRNAKDTCIKYLEGEIFFQIWPPGSSSETRLYVGEKAGKKEYDCVKYENQLFHFNTVDRVRCYFHDIDVDGLDHCYDCRAEVYVFEQYVKNFNKISSMCKHDEEKSKLVTMDIKTHVKTLSKHLEADKKVLKIFYNNKEYNVNFLDIKYGTLLENVCNQRSECKSYGNKKWNNSNRFQFNFNHREANTAEVSALNENLKGSVTDREMLKKRLDFSNKRLNHSVFK